MMHRNMVRIINHTLTVIFYTVCLTQLLDNSSANQSDGKWIQNKGLWYFIYDGQALLNYTEAAAFCASIDSYLAVITNPEQNDYLKNVIANNKYWIGYTSNKKNHDLQLEECQDIHLFWNGDRNCVVKFAPDNFIVANASRSGCSGVYFHSGTWTERPCKEQYRFICQWTCRRLFLSLTGEDTKNISGLYKYGGYYNEHVVYNHEKEEYSISYSLSKLKSKWGITIRSTRKYEYEYANSSDVPYGANDVWYIAESNDVGPNSPVGASCIDCDEFRIQASWDDTYVLVNLIVNSVGRPFYSDPGSVYKISPGQLNGSTYWYVEMNGTNTGTFGNIFPYPKRVTNIPLDNNGTIIFTRTCDKANTPVSTIASGTTKDEEYMYTKENDTVDTVVARNISAPNDGNTDDGNRTIIIGSLVGGAVLVILFVVIVLVLIKGTKKNTIDTSNVEQFENATCELVDSPKSESEKCIANESHDLYDDYYEIEEPCDKPTNENKAKDGKHNSSLRDVQRDINQNPYTLVNGNNQSGKDNINSTDIPMAKLSSVPMRSYEPASDDHRKSQYEETGDILRELEKPDKQQFIPDEKTTFPIDHVYAKVLKPSSINSDKSTDKRKSNPLLSAEMQKQFSESIPDEDSDDLQLHENEIYGTEDFNMSQREMITSTPLRPAAQFVEDNVYEDPEECRTETKEPKCKAESKDTKPPPDQLYSAVQKPLSSIKGNKHQNPLYPKELLQTFTNTQTAADDADELQLHENEIYGTGD